MLSGALNNWELCFFERKVVSPFQDFVALKKVLEIKSSLILKNTLSKLILST